MVKKNITTDDLARMINKGFEKTATVEMFKKIDSRLDKVERKLENLRKLFLTITKLE